MFRRKNKWWNYSVLSTRYFELAKHVNDLAITFAIQLGILTKCKGRHTEWMWGALNFPSAFERVNS